MTADDLTRLRAVAEAATGGPWYRNSGLIWGHDNAVVTDTRNLNHDDAVHIATFDPPTVAALIDRVERAERERDQARRVVRSVLDRAATTPLRDMVGGHPVVTSDYLFGQLRALLTEGADDGQ